MSKLGWGILYVWKQTSERRQSTWSPPFWQGQAIYAGPVAPEITSWDWEQEEVGNMVRKAREGHLRREFQRGWAQSRKMERDIMVAEKLKLGKGGLAQGWDKSGKLLFWWGWKAKESVFTGGSSSAQLRLQQDPEPLLLLHQQIPLNMFKPLNGVVMNRPYRNADLHLHPKVWTRHSKEACSSNLSREKANDWADTR